MNDDKHEVLTFKLNPSTPVACPTFLPSLNTMYVGTCNINFIRSRKKKIKNTNTYNAHISF